MTERPTRNERAASPVAPRIAERTVIVEGVRLATAISEAPRALLARMPLVLLPSAGFLWSDYRPVLERFASERRVFALDWPGFGASAAPAPDAFPPGAYGAARFAELVAGWLDGLGIARAALLGAGIGGEVALRYAAAHTRRTAGLGLLVPTGFAAPGMASGLARALLRSPAIARRLDPLVFSLALGPTNSTTEALAARLRERRAGEGYPATLQALVVLWRSASLADPALPALAREVAQSGIPTLALRGALDPLFPAGDAARLTAAFADAGATAGARAILEVVLPDAGHLPFAQQPRAFFQAVEGWLATAEARAAAQG